MGKDKTQDQGIRADRYRINPGFVPQEPSGADMFSFCELDEYSIQWQRESVENMRAHGARLFRMTVVSEEYPCPPYPHGFWLEGWKDLQAKCLPFGAGRPDDNTVSPPLAAVPQDAPELPQSTPSQEQE